jgi:hypothetical protein
MENKGLSFPTREQAILYAKQQQESGLYPIVYRDGKQYHVIVCETAEEYVNTERYLRGKVSSGRS